MTQNDEIVPEVILPRDLWQSVRELEKLLCLETNDSEYGRLKSLLNSSFAKLLAYDSIISKMKLDIETTIKLLEITSKQYPRATHFVRDELSKCLIEDLKIKLREYEQKIDTAILNNPWDEISF